LASSREVYEQLRQAYAQADAQAAAGLYAPDGVFLDADNRTHTGREAVLEHLKGFFATRGPVQYTVKRQVADEGAAGVVLTEWTSATDEGGRRSAGLPGATVLEVGTSGIVYHRDYQ
jgi:uncharacterized protein (TIGR02246 family)